MIRSFSVFFIYIAIFLCGPSLYAQCPPGVNIVLTATTYNVSCNAGSDGMITLAVSGGTAPYSYIWSNGETTSDIDGLTAGNYTITVTDVNGCQDSLNTFITEPGAFIYNVIITNVKCFGGNDGVLDFSLNGGNPPFSYTWVNTDNGDTIGLAEDINNLTAGIYGLNIVDSKGCKGAIFYYVAQPDSITINGTVTPVRCAGESNGSITTSITGGTGQIAYIWSTGENSRNLLNKPAGIYSVTVTDLSGCSATKTFTITEPDTLQITLIPTNVTCPGENDGSIQTTVTGGTPPYSYLWSNASTSSNLSGLPAGTYSVIVVDINGCFDTASATVLDTNLAITVTAIPDSPTCVGGSDGGIDLTVSGGTPPYTFLWSTGDTTEDISGLPAGTYSVTVTDANGCTSSLANITVTDPPPIQAIVDGITNPVCNADSTGAIDISVTGGTPPYIFNWDNGATTEDISGLTAGQYCVIITDSNNCISDPFCFTVSEPDEITITPNITPITCNGNNDGAIDLTVSGGTPPYDFLWGNGNTTSGLSGLSPGSYSVTVTDANGCTAEGTFTIDEPDTLTLTLTVTNPICNGASDGAIDVEVSGGTAPYTYVWSNGATSQDLTGLPAGNYSITVTDVNGCSDSASATITDPDSISLTAIIQDVRCPGDFNGAIDLTVTGGYSPYTYLWSRGDTTEDIANVGAGSYTVTVTDSLGCEATGTFQVIDPPIDDVRIVDTIPLRCSGDTIAVLCAIVDGVPPPFTFIWSTGATTDCIINVGAGVYSVTVSDDDSCLSYFNNFVLEDPVPIQLSADITSPTCEDSTGAIDLTVSGGNNPFQYSWSTTDTTEDISGLEEGLYTVHVSDSLGCTADGSYSINPIAPMILSLGITNASCNEEDGSATVSVSGGTPPFSYSWSIGATTATVNNLAAGVYEVTVTDANACQESAFVIIDNVSDILLTAATVNTVCGGGNTGAIDVTVSGGIAPYTYSWNNGSTTQDLSGLAAGTYIVTVTDAQGCKRSLVLEISEDSGLTLSINSTSSNCGSNDGTASVTVSGGTVPYTYLWSNGETGSAVSNLSAGIHQVIVTDANGCSASEIVTISDAGGPALTFTKDDLNCLNGNSGSITLNATGGITPYSFVWSTGDSIKDLTGLGSGLYSVTVTDAAGCSSIAIIEIEKPDGIIAVADKYEPSCNGEDDGSIEVTVTGGLAPYSYLWAGGETTEDLSGLSAGNYAITVTDANGCSATTGIILDEPDTISIEIESVTPSGCVGDPNGAIDISVSGGAAPYTYLWNNGDTTEDLTGIGGGTYCVVVTDSNNCSSAPFCITVDEPDQITIIPDITPVTCPGGDDGAVSVNVSGGVAPYTYLWDNGNTTNSISGLTAGPYSITVTDSVECEATLTVTVPEPAPFSYINSVITPATCDSTVDGSILAIITGGTPPYTLLWEDSSSDALRDSLAPGTYTLIVVDSRECSDTTEFTVNSLPCNLPPVAITDTATVFGCLDQSVEIPVLNNDYDPDGDNIFLVLIIAEPNNGSIGLNLTPILVYTPDTGFTGIDTFRYVICDDGSPQLCDTGTVFISVLPCRPNIFIPNGVSPNGDGVNDIFHIDGLEYFPDNELIIFNRWGNKVNEFHPYLNNWTGTNADGENLPDGTYYYILNLNDSANTTFTGYIVINR